MKNSKCKNNAFTLIEILIASVIFLTVILVGTAVFGAAVGNRAKANVVRATQQGARYAVEAISREVRMANVTNSYGNSVYFGFAILTDQSGSLAPDQVPNAGDDHLYRGSVLIASYLGPDGTRTDRRFYLSDIDGNGCDDLVVDRRETPNWTRDNLSSGGFTGAERVTSEDVCVDELAFRGHHIYESVASYNNGVPPTYNNWRNPPDPNFSPLRQPFVTVHLRVRSAYQNNGRAFEQEEMDINTTIASRYYNITGGQFPRAND